MAESQSMTTPEVVAKTLIAEHGDFLREAVAMVATQLMEAEISAQIGAGRGERSPDRATHRNGYRERLWETRVGEIELAVPRKRSGEAYFPSFLEPRRPCEQAIVSVVMEAYVNGVSTRKVDRLVEQLGISSMSKDRVSALCRELDGRVEAFRERPLEGAFPYLWLDAKHLKVRDRGSVRSKALVIAYAVHETGRREVIGIDLGEVESGSFWVEFLRGLVARGLAGVRLAISDEHQGLKAAIARVLACPWQRCTARTQPVLATVCGGVNLWGGVDGVDGASPRRRCGVRDSRRAGSPVGRPERRESRVSVACPEVDRTVAQAAAARCSPSTSAGVLQPRVFLGREFRAAATAARSDAPCRARSVPFGKYWRSRPLVFSLVARCQGQCGSQK